MVRTCPRIGTGDNQDNYLLGVFNPIRVSGSTLDSDCALGVGACDGGLRRVHLSK